MALAETCVSSEEKEDGTFTEKKQEGNNGSSPFKVVPREIVRKNSNKTKNVLARFALLKLWFVLLKLWFVLLMTLGFVIFLFLCAHLTHSLSLRVEAYHALYNFLALSGCLITMKFGQEPKNLKNTFGWARMEILSSFITLIFLLAFCFGVAIESIQTTAHAGHQDAMHHPLRVIAVSALGLCLNALVFFLIGGYTHHQGCFLEKRSSGVWIQKRVPQEAVQSGMRTISDRFKTSTANQRSPPRSYQGIMGILRDISGLILCMVCAAIVHWDGGGTLALYVDPGIALLSVVILVYLSSPYAKECCEILLQTIPGNIDVQTFSERLLKEFPEVINIHHLHIWSLTPGKVIATAHVVFSNPKVYRKSFSSLEEFFKKEDITQVTLQPEFLHLRMDSLPSIVGSKECLLRCTHSLCRQKECCQNCDYDETTDETSAVYYHVEGESSCTLRKHTKEVNKDVNSCVDMLGTNAYRTSDLAISSSSTRIQKSQQKHSKGPRHPACSLWDLTEKGQKASSFLSLQGEHEVASSRIFSKKFNSFIQGLQELGKTTKDNVAPENKFFL